MIYVTAGHEHGIGLEVFLKSYLMLGHQEQSQFNLLCNKKALRETLFHGNITLENDPLNITYVYEEPYSSSALKKSLKLATENDILVTMPTSKDQLILNGKNLAGHTEYFRSFYNTDISMFFKANDFNVLLVTDHIPLKEVPNITPKMIHDKVSVCIDGYEKYFGKLKNIIIAGINPHAGEKGILGSEDKVIEEAIFTLSRSYDQNFVGPIPGDSMLINNQPAEDTLFVYMYHDQGLAPFKTVYKTHGANVSLGLPFLRLSVDHGTAQELYGQNKADYMGSYHVLKMALKAHQKING
jgi:4-hydroxy-L-threonine phosphate dehydrogenase PdxA